MTNHPNRRGKFELTFVGGAPVRHRRYHTSYESAVETAGTVHQRMDMSGRPETAWQRAAHPAIIYGPGCGPDGTTIA